MSRSGTSAAAAAAPTLPTLSSTNLRIGQTGNNTTNPGSGPGPGSQKHAPPHAQSHTQHHSRSHSQARHSALSVVVDTRRPALGPSSQQQQRQQMETMESSDSEQSDSGPREGPGGGGSGDPDYASSPGENMHREEMRRSGRDDGRIHGHIPGRMSMGNEGEGMSLDPEVMATAVVAAAGEEGRGATDLARKHGKRLTTKEEVILFDICNRHAEEFGQRSTLCKWWMTVTAEFTRDQGHPYSWHSVRRKVEVVTKQRMKFLEDQREKGTSEADDMSNPRWRAAVDAWIPTWQRWEEAEARRIEKRDSRRPRKRRHRSWEATSGPVSDHRLGQSPSTMPSLPPMMTPAQNAAVRLPPGFDNMFSTPTSTSVGAAGAGRAPHPPASSPMGTADNGMMTAVLETLGKLNKHLDTVNPEAAHSSSPVVSSLLTGSGAQQRTARPSDVESDGTPDGEDAGPTISSDVIKKLKEELRREMRDELERDRATLEEKLDSVQRTQEMILEMLRQEPG
ncbi:hypothetical protein EYZ11_004850 [Aspergillus tanneri]|nr:hypothetical protein EYZ11_004850 [Aspergillus tanneri]